MRGIYQGPCLMPFLWTLCNEAEDIQIVLNAVTVENRVYLTKPLEIAFFPFFLPITIPPGPGLKE